MSCSSPNRKGYSRFCSHCPWGTRETLSKRPTISCISCLLPLYPLGSCKTQLSWLLSCQSTVTSPQLPDALFHSSTGICTPHWKPFCWGQFTMKLESFCRFIFLEEIFKILFSKNRKKKITPRFEAFLEEFQKYLFRRNFSGSTLNKLVTYRSKTRFYWPSPDPANPMVLLCYVHSEKPSLSFLLPLRITNQA